MINYAIFQSSLGPRPSSMQQRINISGLVIMICMHRHLIGNLAFLITNEGHNICITLK